MDSIESVKSYIESKGDSVFKSKLRNVEKLSGGLVNNVYRLIFEDNSTCVLKYYPPHLGFDSSVTMSQDRYFVEKNALLALGDQPWKSVFPETKIRTPKVIHFDDEKYTFIMEDAGSQCQTLLSILSNSSNDLYDDEFVSHIAREIFIFSNYISCKSNITLKTHRDQLENKPGWDIMRRYVKNLFTDKSNLFETDKELQPYVDKLDHLFNPVDDDEAVFVFGDLWPNSILVDLEKKYLWFVDWEMARFATKLRDLDQLMSNLWIMKQNEKLFNKNRIELLIQNLQLQFFGNKDADWRFNSEKNTQDEFVLWITWLIRYDHWGVDDKRGSILKAIQEIEKH